MRVYKENFDNFFFSFNDEFNCDSLVVIIKSEL